MQKPLIQEEEEEEHEEKALKSLHLCMQKSLLKEQFINKEKEEEHQDDEVQIIELDAEQEKEEEDSNNSNNSNSNSSSSSSTTLEYHAQCKKRIPGCVLCEIHTWAQNSRMARRNNITSSSKSNNLPQT